MKDDQRAGQHEIEGHVVNGLIYGPLFLILQIVQCGPTPHQEPVIGWYMVRICTAPSYRYKPISPVSGRHIECEFPWLGKLHPPIGGFYLIDAYRPTRESSAVL